MGENDIYFRNDIKKITYGRYSSPTADTALSELVKFYAETELKVRKIIDEYQHEEKKKRKKSLTRGHVKDIGSILGIQSYP